MVIHTIATNANAFGWLLRERFQPTGTGFYAHADAFVPPDDRPPKV